MKKILIVLFIIAVVYVINISLRVNKEINFSHTLVSEARPEVVWNYFEAAFTDSAKISNWPNELNEIYTEKLEKGADLIVTYKSPFKTVNLDYKISTLDPGKSMTYQSGFGHPLDGGGFIILRESDAGSELIWRGKYTYRGFSLAAWYFKYYFEDRFFDRLQIALRGLE